MECWTAEMFGGYFHHERGLNSLTINGTTQEVKNRATTSTHIWIVTTSHSANVHSDFTTHTPILYEAWDVRLDLFVDYGHNTSLQNFRKMSRNWEAYNCTDSWLCPAILFTGYFGSGWDRQNESQKGRTQLGPRAGCPTRFSVTLHKSKLGKKILVWFLDI